MVTTPLPTLLQKADSLRADNQNCAQCVARVFAHDAGADEHSIALLTLGLGGGIGGQGLTCGCVTAMVMIDSLLAGPTPKAEAYARATELCREFKHRHGSLDCAELKGRLRVPCNHLIADTIALLHSRHSK